MVEGLPPKPEAVAPPPRRGASPRAASMRESLGHREREREDDRRRRSPEVLRRMGSPPRHDSWRGPSREDRRYPPDRSPRDTRNGYRDDRDWTRARGGSRTDSYVASDRYARGGGSRGGRRGGPPRYRGRSRSRSSRSRSRERRYSPAHHRDRRRRSRSDSRSRSPSRGRGDHWRPSSYRTDSRDDRHSSRTLSPEEPRKRHDEPPRRERSKSPEPGPSKSAPPKAKAEPSPSSPARESARAAREEGEISIPKAPAPRSFPRDPIPPSGPRRQRTPTGPRNRFVRHWEREDKGKGKEVVPNNEYSKKRRDRSESRGRHKHSRSPSHSRSRSRSRTHSHRSPTHSVAPSLDKSRTKSPDLDELLKGVRTRPLIDPDTMKYHDALRLVQTQRVKHEEEHANNMRAVRRAYHEVDLALIELRSAEERRKAAERVHERAVKGFLAPLA